MVEVELPAVGVAADDAVTLARSYVGLRQDVLVPLLAVRRNGEQAVASWADVAATAMPRSLTAQQVVTVGRAIGSALASLHTRGLVHGDVTSTAIVRDADGAPRLARAGQAIWCGRPAAPADDVHGLAAALHELLPADGADVAAVRAALAPALAEHPAARPTAVGLVDALGAAAPPAPLPRRRPTTASPTRVRSRPARRWSRPAGMVLAAGLVAVVVAAVPHGGHTRPKTAPLSPWDTAMRSIAAARWDAFTRADARRLTDADVAGSPAHQVDAQRVASFVAGHAHVRGSLPVPHVVQVLHAGAAVAELVVREAVPAYDEVADTGAVIGRHVASPPTDWRVTLVRTAAGWRTQEVAPA